MEKEDYEKETKAALMARLDTREISYKKKDTKAVFVEKLMEQDNDGEAVLQRLASTAAKFREKAKEIRSAASKHKTPSSRVSAADITKFWDDTITDPAKAREKAIKLAIRRKAQKQAKESRRANR